MTIEQEINGTSPANLDYTLGPTVQPLPDNAKWSSAGIAALLSDEPMDLERTFGMLLTDFDSGSVDTLNRLKGTEVQRQVAGNKNLLMEELANPNTPIERKKEVIDLLAMNQPWQRDSATLASERYLAAPSGNETVEQERRRMDLAERLRPVHEYRQEVSHLKSTLIKDVENTSRFHTVDSFMEFLIPFSTNVEAADTLSRVKESIGKPRQAVRNFLLPGSAKEAIKEAMRNAPPEQLKEWAKKIVTEVKNDSGMVIREDNNLAEMVLFEQLFEEYSTIDKVIDNTVGVLDSTILLSPISTAILKPVQRAMLAARIEKMIANAERQTVVDRVMERSAANVARATNPDKAREIHKIVVNSSDDAAARAAYGTTRDEALASDMLPQIDTVDGSVPVKVPDVDKKVIEIDPDISDAVNSGISYRYTDAELERAKTNIVNDFHNATGMHVHTPMGQVGASLDGDNVLIKGVYGNTEGGFLNADEAYLKARTAFNKRGIKDEEITLLQNKGGRYEPVEYASVKGQEGDFLVQIEMKVPVSGADVQLFEPMSVKYNFLDRMPAFQWARAGNLQRWFVDAGSMFEKYISGSAAVAIDRAAALDKRILEYYHDFAADARALPKDRQDRLMAHIVEANAHNLELTDVELMARGWQPEEMNALHKWRKANDVMFYLENSDLVKTLNHQGFKLLDNGNDRLFAKEVANKGLKEQVFDRATRTYNTMSIDVYDPVAQTVVKLTEKEVDDLYAAGGTFAKLRRPVDFSGVSAEYVKVEQNATNYLRTLRDTDQVLNYRKGYFHVEYDAPVFVVQKVTDLTGKTFDKRIAVASSRKEAEEALQNYATRDGVSKEEWGFIAEDKRAMRMDGDAYWDIQSASGRTAQRHRGKRLEGLTGTNMLGMDLEHIVDPVEASIRAARSLSARVATRDVLETMKMRALQQYGEFFPSDGMGGVRWPSNPSEIVSKSFTTTKDIADARSTFHYIDYLENGYINHMDEGWKWAMNSIANVMGKANLTTLEKAAYGLQNLTPSQTGKELVFHMYIGTNPIRQLIIQPHQSIRMMAYNPKGVLTAYNRVMKFVGSKLAPNAKWSAEQTAFNKAIEESGLMAAVDKQNLVRGALIDMTDASNKAKRTVGKALATPRMFGFDAGERVNMLMHYANVWDKKKRQGLDVFDKRVQEEIHSEARALSYDMNLAGDMPYNQNWAALLMQFAQVPHKAVLQVANRRIAPWDRVKLAAFDTAMWGVPIYAISDWVGEDMLPENQEIRDLVSEGLEQFIFNESVTRVLGKDANIDIRSSFSPYDWGWAETASAVLLDGSLAEGLMKSPSGKMFMGGDSRVGQALTKLGQFLHVQESYGQDPTAWQTVDSFLRISSGWKGISDAYKAAYIREANAAMTKDGVVLDPNRSNFEVLMAVAGFQNKTVSEMYELSEALYKDQKRFNDEVVKTYREVKRTLFEATDKPANELLEMSKVLGEMERVYKHNPEAQKIVLRELEKDARGKDRWILQAAIKAAGRGEMAIPTLIKRIEDMPSATEDDKEAARILMRDAQNAMKYYDEQEE